MDGLILVHKPAQMTSHDVVARIRKTTGSKKVGHFGTLDPWATGLLILGIGKATRLFSFFLDVFKTYRAQIKLGVATDTYDFTGNPLSPEVRDYPGRETLLRNMKAFRGEIEQVPPIFSAKKYRGKPLYVLARKKQKIEPKPCRVIVSTFEITNFDPPLLDCFVRCSSGTYIRSLAHDLGQKLGCGAHLVQLERTSIEPYRLEDSLTLDEIKIKMEEGKFHDVLIPMESLLVHLPKIVLNEAGSRLVRNGNPVLKEHIAGLYEPEGLKAKGEVEREDRYRLFSPDGKLVAIAKPGIDKHDLHPFLVLDSENSGR